MTPKLVSPGISIKISDEPEAPPPPQGLPLEPTEINYIQLTFEDTQANLYYSDQEYMTYFIPRLCEKGLRQHHLINVGGRILHDVHITRRAK